jgi:hypothetical protein
MKEPVEMILLPTEEALLYIEDGVLYNHYPIPLLTDGVSITAQHLYATVSQDVEAIKEDDWFTRENSSYGPFKSLGKGIAKDARKIIATTDHKLNRELNGARGETVTDIFPQLPQSFLKEFVANPSGRYEVEYETVTHNKGLGSWVPTFTTNELKLNQDKTVNITSIEDKMYSNIDLMGNQDGGLDYFLLHSPKFSQEEREVIMDAVYDWITQNL